ncbi:MAG TPA: flagellar biosynthesis protein FlgB, partial [Gammaproteobacteria bacterium]|nr:flagellar biosynthesis protein FlgB [Gammaproteobacteria bacterium]
MPDEAPAAYRYPRARIAVFARAPLPGQVKTRLQAELGPEGCLLLYTAMLDRLLATLRSAELAPVELWVSSNIDHKVFLSHCNKKDIYLQNGQDLGQKMSWTAGRVLANSAVGGVLIIGTDCPAMDAAYLEGALIALQQGNDVVIGPAEDGGYVLIGLKQPCPGLFQGIEWGS